jgi:SAM-dependent methyltransferase
MKLNELVGLQLKLDSVVDFSSAEKIISDIGDSIENLAFQADNPHKEKLLELANVYRSAVKLLKSSSGTVDVINNQIDQEIIEKSQHFFTTGYQNEFEYDGPDSVRKVRHLHVSDDVNSLMKSRLNQLIDWRYPALEIGCRDGEWSQHLVAADPLYIADVHQEFLDSTAALFHPNYQQKLRRYLIQATTNDDGIKEYQLPNLPKGQFNLVFSWNFFNYITLDDIKKYLVQIYDILRPGGVFIFTFNNGDLTAGAAYAENYYMTYVPKSMLVPMCTELGFEVVYDQDINVATSWLEIRKPGKLQTVKLVQSLGEIKHRTN